MFNKKTVMGVLCALLIASAPAHADHSSQQESIRGWIAESMQWRLSYLPTEYQTADMLNPFTGANTGAATVTRSRNGISGRVMTNVETAGDPYTLWVIVFNNPGACATPFACFGPIDTGTPEAIEATGAVAFNGNGAISSSNGEGGGVVNIDFNVVAGNLPEGLFVLFGDEEGLERGNGFGSEILLVIDKHPRPDASVNGSWVADLTETNFPFQGPAITHRVAVFRATE